MNSSRLILYALFISLPGYSHTNIAIGAENNSANDANQTTNWPQWRGPIGTGESPSGTPPIDWTATENIQWKTELPGRGHSSPIVWDDHLFVTAAEKTVKRIEPRMSGRPGAHDNLPVDSEFRFLVICLDRKDGSIRWQREVHRAIPQEGSHYTGSLASPSMVTDGEKVYASFGSHGIYCLDFAGKIAWQKTLGTMHTKHGHGDGSSPTLWNHLLLINWDHEGESFLVALDKSTGEEIWKRERREVTSWSTPVVANVNGNDQLIVCGTERVRGYDLETGKPIWECGGMSANIVATPVYSDGVVFVGSSYEKRALMAIDIRGAKGDVSGSERILWFKTQGTPYVPSPLLANQKLYYLNHYQNVMTIVDALSGKPAPGAIRLGELGNIYASPVYANGKIYVTDLDGNTLVLKDGDAPRKLAVNRIGEPVAASLAIVDQQIFVRSDKHLFCISNQSDSSTNTIKP